MDRGDSGLLGRPEGNSNISDLFKQNSNLA
jgi:hypothetical protein